MKQKYELVPNKPYGLSIVVGGKKVGWVWEEDGSWCAEEFQNGMSWDTLGGDREEAVQSVLDSLR